MMVDQRRHSVEAYGAEEFLVVDASVILFKGSMPLVWKST